MTAVLAAAMLAGVIGWAGPGVGQVVDPAAQCEAGKASSCIDAGLAIERRGNLTPQLWQQVVALYRRGCELGSNYGCNNLANQEMRGVGTPRDPKAALARFDSLCAGGFALGCQSAGYWLSGSERSGLRADYERSRAYYTRGCDGGQGAACFALGNFFETGTGVAKNRVTAQTTYERACAARRSSVDGCFRAGFLAEDLGLDVAVSIPWYERGCQANGWGSCNNLGKAIQRVPNSGTGGQQRSIALFERACTMGKLEQACKNLAVMRDRTILVPNVVVAQGLRPDTASCNAVLTQFNDAGTRFLDRMHIATARIKGMPSRAAMDANYRDLAEDAEKVCVGIAANLRSATGLGCQPHNIKAIRDTATAVAAVAMDHGNQSVHCFYEKRNLGF